jgi:hypothetical protein
MSTKVHPILGDIPCRDFQLEAGRRTSTWITDWSLRTRARLPTLFSLTSPASTRIAHNIMANLRGTVVKTLHSNRLHRSAGAIAGSALAVRSTAFCPKRSTAAWYSFARNWKRSLARVI